MISIDQGLSALFTDLYERGLEKDVTVLVWSEFGRSPTINKDAGRDHWPTCGFCVLAGGGIKSGLVLGTSDAQAGYVKEHPVSPGDICVTIYHLLGIDPNTMVPDSTNRPHSITHGGSPIDAVLV